MYEAYYGLNQKPFSLLPDPGFLFLTKGHKMGLVMLEYGLLNSASISVITGEIGSGKTTLIRQLLKQLDQNITAGMITNTHHSFGQLLQLVLLAYNLDYHGKDKVELYDAFVNFIIQEYAQNRRTVLIIDEAQNMTPEALEELRMLSNVNSEKDHVLQLILIGQPELRKTLCRPDLIQLAQRIAVDYHLTALTREETHGYIQHRITLAGGDPALFETAACDVVHDSTGGVPRMINVLCDTALVYAFAEEQQTVTQQLIADVVRDKRKGGIFPLAGELHSL